jgi:hypothetical protein
METHSHDGMLGDLALTTSRAAREMATITAGLLASAALRRIEHRRRTLLLRPRTYVATRSADIPLDRVVVRVWQQGTEPLRDHALV